MYAKRIKIFVVFIALLLFVCLLRLAQMQLLSNSFYSDEIAKLKRGGSRPLKTVRGRVLDRKHRVLAVDEPQFQLCISYTLTSFADQRIVRSKLLKAARRSNPDEAKAKVREKIHAKLEDLQQIIDKCTYFGLERVAIEDRIREINNEIWSLRTYLAWKRNYPNLAFEQAVPDANDRLSLAAEVDIAEMHKSWPLLELDTNDDVFTAQLEFSDFNDVEILPKAQRSYPYGSVAAQTIGWVGLPQKDDKELFANDKLSSYLDDEVCGRRPGVEYVCETILRGRRGQEIYDIDRELINRTETRFGKDVSLTLDIELQERIEKYLANCELNPNCKAPIAAVVIDVAAADILALVSMPVFDLNRIRYDYTALAHDPNEPLRNRAINKQYPPGSVIKPLILIAGLESGKIDPHQIISCPAQEAPKGWPSCWLYNRYHWMGHDDMWENNAHNAIKGSCNIYFSQLADRIEPSVLQQWLFKFGYGRKIPLAPAAIRETEHNRNLRQAPGIISSANPEGTIAPAERRYFGIGQGNLRVTPLQVADAMATIARGGLYKLPRLFIPPVTASADSVIASANSVIASAAKQSQFKIQNSKFEIRDSNAVDLGISPQTLALIRDGMSAVVNEPGGTAYKEFEPVLVSLAEQGIKVYGKTGSTEKPDNAWFAGFATDGKPRSISIAVMVEGGQHGSKDAAPIARDIIQFCIDAEYIGKPGFEDMSF